MDISEKRIKHQLKYADKIGARYVLVVGSDEMNTHEGEIRDMRSGETKKIRLDSNFMGDFVGVCLL